MKRQQKKMEYKTCKRHNIPMELTKTGDNKKVWHCEKCYKEEG